MIGEARLPIEREQRVLWRESMLVNEKEEINLYTVGVRVEQIQTDMCEALVLSPIGDNN